MKIAERMDLKAVWEAMYEYIKWSTSRAHNGNIAGKSQIRPEYVDINIV